MFNDCFVNVYTYNLIKEFVCILNNTSVVFNVLSWCDVMEKYELKDNGCIIVKQKYLSILEGSN